MAELKAEEIKDFLQKTCDLETKIYATQKIIDTLEGERGHQRALTDINCVAFTNWWENSKEYRDLPKGNYRPEEKVEAPVKDKEYILKYINRKTRDNAWEYGGINDYIFVFIFGIISIFILIFGVGAVVVSRNIIAFIVLLLVAILPFNVCKKHLSFIVANIKLNSARNIMYKDIDKQNSLIEQNNKIKEEKKKECDIVINKVKEETYNKMLPVFEQNANYISEEINGQNDILNSAKIELSKLYSKNVIHEKYRGLVPIYSLYEYFDTGRCSSLVGPNGAYNLYENELRQNIIIYELVEINENLAEIKNNQFYLFNALNAINQNISSLSAHIDEVSNTVAGVGGAISQAVHRASENILYCYPRY